MAGAAEEAEVLAEVEAVQAVYGEDCRILRPFPPHVDVCIRPRTADDSSQQFVEAILGIRAGPQYPDEPPRMILVESKGLDEKRKEHLTSILQNKAQELSSCVMLVALCEEAVEALSNMNHPEGNCPLCLYPLFQEGSSRLPFMKLMSCFHCFHSECILRWWNWLQQQTENNVSNQLDAIRATLEYQRGMHANINKQLGNCPVCRMGFQSKDIDHVLDLLETCTSKMVQGTDAEEEEEKSVLQSDAEYNRRQQFEGLLKLQHQNRGLIEPKKDLVIMPGMFLPERATPATASLGNSDELSEDTELNSTTSAVDSNSSRNEPTLHMQKHSGTRKGRSHTPRKHPSAQSSMKQWIRKGKSHDQ